MRANTRPGLPATGWRRSAEGSVPIGGSLCKAAMLNAAGTGVIDILRCMFVPRYIVLVHGPSRPWNVHSLRDPAPEVGVDERGW